mgnify:CR=1 FL=1
MYMIVDFLFLCVCVVFLVCGVGGCVCVTCRGIYAKVSLIIHMRKGIVCLDIPHGARVASSVYWSITPLLHSVQTSCSSALSSVMSTSASRMSIMLLVRRIIWP